MKTNDPAPAALRVTGDVTIQMVITFFRETTGTGGTVLFSCDGRSGNQADNEAYAFLLTDTPGKLEPNFRYEHSSGTRVSTTDTTFYMTPSVPHHIVGRRWDAGGGSITTQLWVDGVKIKELTGQTACDGGTTSFMNIGRQSSGAVAVREALIHGIKVVDRKLTDSELTAEFDRTGLGV